MKLKHLFQKYLIAKGVYSSEVTSNNDLSRFCKMMRPIAQEKQLIRIGANADGGYLVPDDVDDLGACFSPGVEQTSSFESALASKGVKSYMADYSVESAPSNNSLFNFEKKYLGDINNDKYIRLEDWVSDKYKESDKDLMLQMDIEGGEFPVILDTPVETLRKFRIMVIEFHHMKMVFSKHTFSLVNHVFTKILRDFTVVHIHPNNCSPKISNDVVEVPDVFEITFYRKDRANNVDSVLEFPHALDFPNAPDKEDIILPKCCR